MISDRIFITDKSKNHAKTIINNLKNEKIILIYGGSGTQKTETADCLQELLYQKRKQSVVLSLDDFYLTHPTIRNENRKKLGIESVGISEIDWEELKRICVDFKNKKQIRIQRVHKYAEIVEHLTLNILEIDYLIIEGLFAGYLKKDNFGDYAIYLEGTPYNTFEFRQMRGKENENDSFRKKIVRKEYNVVCQLKRLADLILAFEGE